MISAGRVRVNNQSAKPSQKIKPGDVVDLDKPKPTPLLINGQPSALEILFEDSACLVINKPAGVAAHPGPGHWDDTLLNALLDHALRAGVVGMSGLVHRLDKDTSGVMVVAKTKTAHGRLAVQFEQHSITRQYEALVQGVPQHSHGRIELPLGTDRNNVKRTSPTRCIQRPHSLSITSKRCSVLRPRIWCLPRGPAAPTRYEPIFTRLVTLSWEIRPTVRNLSVRWKDMGCRA